MSGLTEEPNALRLIGEAEPVLPRKARKSRKEKRPPGAPREKQYMSLKAKLVTYLVLAPIAILFVAPFAWMISASFQPMSTIFSNPPTWFPDDPTLEGYKGFLNVGTLTEAQQQVFDQWQAAEAAAVTAAFGPHRYLEEAYFEIEP